MPATSVASDLPSNVDLRAGMPAVYEQSSCGSCTGQAVAGAAQYLLAREGLGDWTPSRLALYYGGRLREGSTTTDAGAIVADVLVGAATEGLADESLWPYDVSQFALPPPRGYTAVATHTRIVNHEPLAHDLDTLRWTLHVGHPVVFGASVFESFDAVAMDGNVPYPSRNERRLGGHAMVIVGYRDGDQRFVVRNSWGTAFGDAGYCYIPYGYLTDPMLCGELHAVRAVRHVSW